MPDEKTARAAEAEALSPEPLPDPAPEIEVTGTLDPATKEEIDRRVTELDMENPQTIVKFGAGAQSRLNSISDEMLEGVRNKEVGPVGATLREMVTTLRGFEIEEIEPGRRRSWWERVFSRSRPIANFIARYETVRGQIDEITDRLLGHETVLLKDLKMLEKLYGRSLDFFHELGLYIAAGEIKLGRLDGTEIPELRRRAQESEGDAAMLASQQLRDLSAARDELERRVHDLRLTRQVTMQSLPSIRMVQENDKSLVVKINSTIANTLPLWRNQLAQGVAVLHSREAAGALREATDLTDELLRTNAEQMRAANREVREESERSIVSIDSVRQANETLLATIEDTLRIAEEGRARRADAEEELERMEGALREALADAGARPEAREGKARSGKGSGRQA
ncbi:MAG TPA: toxic anion resistance protein [Thermohalobaculum sp.]|nr:toxic anion resistance protein [Thermohalobaculum sp.]